MENNYNYERIEDYVLGRLSETDRATLEAEMTQDTQLASAVAAEQALMTGVASVGQSQLKDKIGGLVEALDFDSVDVPIYGDLSDDTLLPGIEEVGRANLKDKVSTLSDELMQDGTFDELFKEIETSQTTETASPTEAKVRTLRPIRRVLAIAAGVAILIFGTWLAFFQNTGTALDQHFTPYANVVSPNLEAQIQEMGMGTGGALADLEALQRGMQAYESGEYATAISNLANKDLSILESSDQSLINFYLALAYLGDKRANEAISILETLSTNTNFEQRVDAQWYLLLAYLETENLDRANALKADLMDHPKYGELVRQL
ncbi:MAG: hypothetical protein AAF960_09880 [Bacteroidota bacterium]